MMVDIDDKLLSQAREPGPFDVATLHKKCRVIFAFYIRRDNDQVRAGQHGIGRRDFVAEQDGRLFAEALQHPVKRQSRTQPVAIRTDMRRDHELGFFVYELDYFTKHTIHQAGASRERSPISDSDLRLCERLESIFIHPVRREPIAPTSSTKPDRLRESAPCSLPPSKSPRSWWQSVQFCHARSGAPVDVSD